MGDPRASAVTVRAPAKINLQLSVGGVRPDGYHELATVFHAVSLFDEISAEPGEGVVVHVEGDQADLVPVDASNLAVRAARLLALRTGVPANVHLRLRKGIPVAGGMAGGSADGAAALVACDLLWGTGLAREELLDLAAELGADAPFALVGGTAVGTGRGEALTPALARGELHWVLALSSEGLSTPAVYAEFDRLQGTTPRLEPRVSQLLMQGLRAGDAVAVGRALVNDLQEAACHLRPGLRRTLAVGQDYGAHGSIVSGSGPTVAFLLADAEAALDLAVALTATGTCSSVARAHGPVHGVRSVDPPRVR